jgi:hypothetical protein
MISSSPSPAPSSFASSLGPSFGALGSPAASVSARFAAARVDGLPFAAFLGSAFGFGLGFVLVGRFEGLTMAFP